MSSVAHSNGLSNGCAAGGPSPSAPPLLPRRILFHPAFKTSSSAQSASSLPLIPINTVQYPHKNEDPNVAKPKNSDVEELPSWLRSARIQRIGGGLSNLGNTCFLNSVLQCLTYTPPLAAYLNSGRHKVSCHIGGFCAMCALEVHAKQALAANGRTISPTFLVKNLRCISKSFQMCCQEDAHEYMRYFVDALQKCSLKDVGMSFMGSHMSLIQTIFGGRFRSQVKCTQCSHCSNTYDPFLDLSLEVVKADSLANALAKFTAVEVLDGDNKYQCSKCKTKVKALKDLTIDRTPHVLTIQFKRFSNSGVSGGKKVDKHIHFERTLDMTPFVTGEEGVCLQYSLYAVLVHSGWSTYSGHYFCFVRTGMGMWHMLDDSRVSQVSEKTVLEQKAYIIFYIRDTLFGAVPQSTHCHGGIKNGTSTSACMETGVSRRHACGISAGFPDSTSDQNHNEVVKHVDLVTSYPGERPPKGNDLVAGQVDTGERLHHRRATSSYGGCASPMKKIQNGLGGTRVSTTISTALEAAVPQWSEEEGCKMGGEVDVSNAKAHCGYVLDEWDEEYDRGKCKKVRNIHRKDQSMMNIIDGSKHESKRRKIQWQLVVEGNGRPAHNGSLFQVVATAKSKGDSPREKRLKRWSRMLGHKMFLKRAVFKHGCKKTLN